MSDFDEFNDAMKRARGKRKSQGKLDPDLNLDVDDPAVAGPLAKPKLVFPEGFVPTDDQAIALDQIAAWLTDPSTRGEELALTGCAGTGKSSCMKIVKSLLDGVTWTAMTGKAALRLRQAASVHATTLHSALYYPPDDKDGSPEFNRVKPPETTTLVIDESSMVTPSIREDLQEWRQEYDVRVLYVGDGFQLPPVLSKDEEKKHGKGDYSVFDKVSGPTLTRVMRSGDDVLAAATLLRETGQLPQGKVGTSYEFRRTLQSETEAVEDYLNDMDDHLLITWTNATRMIANMRIRERLGFLGHQPNPGERILVRKNAVGGTVLNGEVHEVASIEPSHQLGPVPTVAIITTEGKYIHAHARTWDGSSPYIEDREQWKSYKASLRRLRIPDPLPITYGYCLTAHQCQGSEGRRVTVFLPRRDTQVSHWRTPTKLPRGGTAPFAARFLYTALTRAKERASILMGM